MITHRCMRRFRTQNRDNKNVESSLGGSGNLPSSRQPLSPFGIALVDAREGFGCFNMLEYA